MLNLSSCASSRAMPNSTTKSQSRSSSQTKSKSKSNPPQSVPYSTRSGGSASLPSYQSGGPPQRFYPSDPPVMSPYLLDPDLYLRSARKVENIPTNPAILEDLARQKFISLLVNHKELGDFFTQRSSELAHQFSLCYTNGFNEGMEAGFRMAQLAMGNSFPAVSTTYSIPTPTGDHPPPQSAGQSSSTSSSSDSFSGIGSDFVNLAASVPNCYIHPVEQKKPTTGKPDRKAGAHRLAKIKVKVQIVYKCEEVFAHQMLEVLEKFVEQCRLVHFSALHHPENSQQEREEEGEVWVWIWLFQVQQLTSRYVEKLSTVHEAWKSQENWQSFKSQIGVHDHILVPLYAGDISSAPAVLPGYGTQIQPFQLLHSQPSLDLDLPANTEAVGKLCNLLNSC